MCMPCGFGRCALSTRDGIDAAAAHVRRRRIQGCLIRQVMIANTLWGSTGKGDWDGHLGGGAASNKQARQGKTSKGTRLVSSQPAPAIPAQHVFLLLLPVIHSRRVGEARRGNVRQCKARQGNNVVLVPCST